MNKSKKIINQSISILMLAIYLFSSLSILSSHNHNDHYHDLPVCENHDDNTFNNSDYSHESQIISSKESCAICDYFTNCKPGIVDISFNTAVELVTVKQIQLFASFYIIDANNNRNKSPPFII